LVAGVILVSGVVLVNGLGWLGGHERNKNIVAGLASRLAWAGWGWRRNGALGGVALGGVAGLFRAGARWLAAVRGAAAVAEALADPRPDIPHEEVRAEILAETEALKRQPATPPAM